MYRYEDLRHVHLEPTTRCNASCPMCARNARGRIAPGLPLTELTIDDVRSVFPEALVRRLSGFDLCGAYGDPAVARDLLEIVDYVRAANPTCRVKVFTNGGVRASSWWERLAAALRPGSGVVFAIDGLADTNHVYRRGVDFDRVMANARAFIQSGGEAQWDFIAFRHNEHQVEEAERLSDQMGFRRFVVKRTARFLKPAYDFVPELEGVSDLSRFPIYEDGRVVGALQPPADPQLVNDTARRYTELAGRHGSLEGLFSATSISCRVQRTASVFVSAQGHAFPCCWTYAQATAPLVYGNPRGADRQLLDLVELTGGFARIDTRARGLRDAVHSPLFEAIEASWKQPGLSSGRLKVCARVCGTEFPAFRDQFSSPELVPGEA